MKKLFLLLACAAMVSSIFAADPVLTIKKAKKAPTIDGTIDANDPYTAADLITMTKNASGNKTSAMSAKFYLTYDDANLYMVTIETGDNQVDTDGTAITATHEADCMEVFVKMDTTSGATGTYIGGDYQFRERRGAIFPDRFDQNGTPTGGTAVTFAKEPGFKIGQVDETSGFTMEWQMPWASLLKGMGDNASNWTKQYIKYDQQVADNTTGSASGRTQQLFWNNNSDLQWNNTTKLGLVYLETAVVTGINDIAKQSLTFSVAGNQLKASKKVNSATIYNLTGAQIATFTNGSIFNISSLTSGAYIVKGTVDGQSFAQKFVKK